MRRPLRCVGAGFAQDPFAERNDQSALLRQRYELVRGNETALGMAPADQRFDAASIERVGIDDRLVMQLELITRDRPAHVILELAALARRRLHSGLEQTVAVASERFGPVEGEIGILEQRIRIGSILRRERDADTGLDRESPVLKIIWLGDDREYPVGETRCGLLATARQRHQDG